MRIGSRGAAIGALLLAAVLVGTPVADAATGGTLLLGHRNTATAATKIINTKGTPLALVAGRGAAPLAVNSRTKVKKLNADEVDGFDSTQLQRLIVQTCPAGQAIRGVSWKGRVTCQDAGGFSSTIASLSQGVGIAYCPAGSSAVGGGVIPDATGLTDLPYIVVDGPHITGDTLDGWAAIVSDNDGSYNGTGVVYVSCTTAKVPLTTSSGVSNAQIAPTVRAARAQFEARH